MPRAKTKKPEIPVSDRIGVVYVRVSDQGIRGKAGSGREFLSPDIQFQEGVRHLEQLGIRVDRELSAKSRDISQSAFDRAWDARPGMRAAVEAALDDKVTDIYCFLKSRLGRDTLESLTLMKIFEGAGVKLHFGDGARDIADPDSKLMLTMELAFAEHESAKKRMFGIKAARARVLKNMPHGKAPGWLTRDRVTGQWSFVPDQYALMRRIIELRLKGLGTMRIAQQLELDDMRGPKGGHLNQGHVLRILGPHYMDLMLGNHTYAGAGFDEPVRLTGVWPAIVTPEESEALVAIGKLMMPRGPRTKAPGRRSETVFILSGIARCAVCGGSLTSHDTTFTHGRSYVCLSGRYDSTKHDLRGLAIRAEQLEDGVLRVVRYAIENYSKQIPEPQPTAKEARPAARRKNQDTVQSLTQQLDRLLQMHTAAILPLEDYQRNAEQIIRRRSALIETERKAEEPREHTAAQTAITEGNIRMAILVAVEAIEAPIIRSDVAPHSGGHARRIVRVTLKWDTEMGRVIDAPLYRPNWEQERILLPACNDEIRDPKLLNRGTRRMKRPPLMGDPE